MRKAGFIISIVTVTILFISSIIPGYAISNKDSYSKIEKVHKVLERWYDTDTNTCYGTGVAKINKAVNNKMHTNFESKGYKQVKSKNKEFRLDFEIITLPCYTIDIIKLYNKNDYTWDEFDKYEVIIDTNTVELADKLNLDKDIHSVSRTKQCKIDDRYNIYIIGSYMGEPAIILLEDTKNNEIYDIHDLDIKQFRKENRFKILAPKIIA